MVANNYGLKSTPVSKISLQKRPITIIPYLCDNIQPFDILLSMKVYNYDLLIKEIKGIYFIKASSNGLDPEIRFNRAVIAWKSKQHLIQFSNDMYDLQLPGKEETCSLAEDYYDVD